MPYPVWSMLESRSKSPPTPCYRFAKEKEKENTKIEEKLWCRKGDKPLSLQIPSLASIHSSLSRHVSTACNSQIHSREADLIDRALFGRKRTDLIWSDDHILAFLFSGTGCDRHSSS